MTTSFPPEQLRHSGEVDLAGSSPVLVQAGTNELLLDDSTGFAQRALDADVDVLLDVTSRVPHHL